jgi:hypothetical protein
MGANPMVAQPMTFGTSGAASSTAGATLANPTGIPGFSGTGLGLTPPPSAIQAQQAVQAALPQTVTQAPALSQQGLMNQAAARVTPGSELFSGSGLDTLKAGAREVMNDPSRFMTKDNLKYGLAGLAPMLMQEQEPTARAERKPFEYTYNPGRVEDPQAGYTGAYTGERTYFNPTYTRTAAGGGMMDSGPLQALSDRNEAETLMANGGQRFAEGGEAKAVKPVEQDPYYTMSGQSGDAFKYLMGQGSAPTAPASAVPAASTGMSGFLGGITGIASPEGTQKTDGTFVPWSDSNPKPTGGGFFGKAAAPVITAAPPAAVSGGVADASNTTIRPYSFDPATGAFTALPIAAPPPPSVFRGFDPGYSYGYGDSGVDSGTSVSDGTGAGAGTGNAMAQGGIASLAQGGQSHLGDYSDGGRLLRGPGDGVSDSIPASIGAKRPARLADGEFVVPARIVSELGNGSTEAGARKLYAMMDRVQKARGKTTGKNRVAVNSKAEKLLPA